MRILIRLLNADVGGIRENAKARFPMPNACWRDSLMTFRL